MLRSSVSMKGILKFHTNRGDKSAKEKDELSSCHTRSHFQHGSKTGEKSKDARKEKESEATTSLAEVCNKAYNQGGFKRSLSVTSLHKNEPREHKKSWRFGSWSHRPTRKGYQRLGYLEEEFSSNNTLTRGHSLMRSLSIVQPKVTAKAKKLSTLARNVRTRRRSYSVSTTDSTDLPHRTSKFAARYAQQSEQFRIDCGDGLSSFSFSPNVWYYGELEVVRGYRRNLRKTGDFVGSMIVRRSRNGELVYTISYTVGDQLLSGRIPRIGGRYCLSNATEPKFNNLNELIDYLIKKKQLYRVTFEWLLLNAGY